MADIEMQGVVEPTYNKRRKGYTFKMDDMEVFVKGEDKDDAIRQMQELLDKEDDKEETEVSRFAEGGMEDGGLKDEGGSVDPVSGNDVPSGSTKKEVRDDIPAQLSEGEFVFPADVVRYIGLENLMELRQKAKMGLQRMEDMGQMGNSDEAIMDDDGPYKDDIDKTIEALEPEGAPVLAIGIGPAPQEMAMGGMANNSFKKKKRTPFKRPSNAMNMQVGGYVPPPSPMFGMPMQQQQTPSPLTGMSPEQRPTTLTQNMPVRTYNEGGVAMGAQAPAGTRLGTAQRGLGLTGQRYSQYTPQYSSRQYYNPETNEIRVINFINGQPAPPGIPAGFQPYDPATAVEETTKEATKELQVDRADGSDDRGRDDQRDAEYKEYQDTISALSELDPEFAEKFAETGKASKMQLDIATGKVDPSFMDTLTGMASFGGIAGAVPASIKGERVIGDTLRGLADQYNIDVDPFETFGFLTDKTGLLNEIRTKSEARSLSEDMPDLPGVLKEAREEIESLTDRERERGRETYESLKEQGISVADSGLTGRELTAAQEAAFDEIRAESRRSGRDEDDDDDRTTSGGGVSQDDIDAQGAAAAGDTSVGMSDEDAESAAAAGEFGGFAKGGAVKQRKKKGLGRLKTK